MATNIAESVKQIFLPKKKTKPDGTSYTSTYNPTSTGTALSLPQFRNHLIDIFTSRQASDSRTLLKDLVKYDPDVSAAIHAYLTLSSTTPRFFVYNQDGQLDPQGQSDFQAVLGGLVRQNDYTFGFAFTKSIMEIAEDLRYMVLLRGSCAGELVFNKLLQPDDVRLVDPVQIEWYEAKPGQYKPRQKPPGANTDIDLDIPNFFVKNYRQNPTEIYSESMFVSAINTIAARQQVINDLYRIMQKTGYPRIDISVAEEVLRKNFPAGIKTDEKLISQWINARLNEIVSQVNSLRADSAFIHMDSVDTKILNEKGPGASLNVTDIISVLNSQNQAALKVVATVIGRGESGVNTASVEARIFSMSADSLNRPIADIFSDMFTLAMRLSGFEGYVVCMFDPCELRPETELEPMKTLKQARLLENLSLGLITDDEYHIQMFGRPAPSESTPLAGTGFMHPVDSNAAQVSPNSDPLGRSLSPEGAKSAGSDSVKKSTKKTSKNSLTLLATMLAKYENDKQLG